MANGDVKLKVCVVGVSGMGVEDISGRVDIRPEGLRPKAGEMSTAQLEESILSVLSEMVKPLHCFGVIPALTTNFSPLLLARRVIYALYEEFWGEECKGRRVGHHLLP